MLHSTAGQPSLFLSTAPCADGTLFCTSTRRRGFLLPIGNGVDPEGQRRISILRRRQGFAGGEGIVCEVCRQDGQTEAGGYIQVNYSGLLRVEGRGGRGYFGIGGKNGEGESESGGGV